MPKALFLIASDPRTSPRPAEAIRIAAGVGTWQRTEVSLYLREAAVLLLGDVIEDLIDSDNFVRYLPMVKEWGRPAFVQENSSWLNGLGPSAYSYRGISDLELAELAARSDYLLRF